MTFSLLAEGIRAILLDIEGTTTPIAFVYGVLFPFARARAYDYLKRHLLDADLQETLAALEAEHSGDAAAQPAPHPVVDNPPEGRAASLAAYVGWLMDRDRKSPGLKGLQGRIWDEGYLSGELKGQVFPDVKPALERWAARRIDVRIFSSGSVLAQRWLFASCPEGDLTKLLDGYFDTAIGPKQAPLSYVAIARAVDRPPSEILFISDVVAELDAARSAGLRTLLSVRPGNPPQPAGHEHRAIESFEEIE